MILVKIIGGLGNQLFQYSMGRNLALKRNAELKLDISGFDAYQLRSYCLDRFNIVECIASPDEIKYFKKFEKKPGKINYLRNKFYADPDKYFTQRQFHFDPEVLNLPDNCYLDGYWQTEKYFKDIEDIIRKEITIKTSLEGKNLEVAQRIGTSNSVCIHVRRGDYVSDPRTNAWHGTCDPLYYTQAMEIIASRVSKPQIFVFSDEIAWVKENITFPYPTEYVDHNDDSKNYEDLRLMSTCKHFIIANSSFSWWGAWLATHQHKIVIGPQKWFAGPKRNLSDLLPENWIRL